MDAHEIEAKETVSASARLGRDDAEAMAREASKLIVAKGRKVREFELSGEPSDEALEAMLGPTGNLRAPTIRRGKTLLVGFDEGVYGDTLL